MTTPTQPHPPHHVHCDRCTQEASPCTNRSNALCMNSKLQNCENVLIAVKHDCRDQLNETIHAVFLDWKQKMGKSANTCLMREVLEDIGYNSIAERLLDSE
ncbi:hypothetical protein ScPMuIL_009070 [Solemya velum]